MGRSCRLEFSANGGSCLPCLRSSPEILVSNGDRLLWISFSERGLSLDERGTPLLCKAHASSLSGTVAGFSEFVAGLEDISNSFSDPKTVETSEDVWIRTPMGLEMVDKVMLEAIQGDVSLRMVIEPFGCSFVARNSESIRSFFIAHKDLGQLAFSEEEVRWCA